jgi:hypothetical protein
VCRTGCVTLREGHNAEGVQDKHDAEEDIWPKTGEITEGWRNFNNEELHDLYCSLYTHTIWVIIPVG